MRRNEAQDSELAREYASIASNKKRDLKEFLCYVYDRNLLNTHGEISKGALRREYRNYAKHRNPVINMEEFGRVLYCFGFLENTSEEGYYRINLGKLRRIVEGSEENKDFEDVTDPEIIYHVTIERKFEKDFVDKKNICFICYQNYEINKLTRHVDVQHQGRELNISKNYTVHGKLFEVRYRLFSRREEVLFQIINNFTGATLNILNVMVYNGDDEFINLRFENDEYSYPFQIEEGNFVELYVNKMYFNKSRFKYSILIQCLAEDNKEFIEQHHLWVSEALFKNPSISGTRPIILDELPSYTSESAATANSRQLKNLNATNYVNSLMELVDIENTFIEREFKKYDKFDVVLEAMEKTRTMRIKISMLELLPKIEEEIVSRVVLMDMRKLPNFGNIDNFMIEKEKDIIFAEVIQFSDDSLIIDVETNPKSEMKYIPETGRKFFLRFIPNRITSRTEKFALSLTEAYGLSPFLFPDTLYRSTLQYTDFTWFNEKISTNEQQISAIKHIVNGTAYPAPYIIFGPPGTGKTMTLVETIAQIWKNKRNANILVTTSSNAACDEIAERLIKYIPAKDLLRYFSKSNQRREELDLIQKVSNVGGNNKRTEYWEIFLSYRIVLCTLTTAGKLSLAKIDPEHFNYIVIDECGSATEPSALIPIVVSSIPGEILANIVLTGDPKQLGPVILSKEVEMMGLGNSMLDRLMKTKLYKKNSSTNSYDSRIVTKLLYNYRSHPCILKLSNELFYDNDLKCCGNTALINFGLNWSELPNKKFPIIFDSINGLCQQQQQDMSLFNQEEIDRVIFYIEKLLTFGIDGRTVSQDNIGVVTPYKKQCTIIKEELNKRFWHKIEVGSVEQYQGREKKIILLSTVRSNTRNIGFLINEKRFNVALTRAQSLLIIVGNAVTLEKDVYWQKLIQYCKENNAFREHSDEGNNKLGNII